LADSPASDAPVSPPPRPGFLRRNWGKLTLFVIIGVPLLVFGIWSAAALTFVYSSGSRVGFAQKLSKKGWICKTWEGELAMSTVPGVMPEKFTYTVWGDSLADAIGALEGKRVKLTYEQHRFLPNSCFGETEYFVKSIAPVTE
jgi:hypothetical protein